MRSIAGLGSSNSRQKVKHSGKLMQGSYQLREDQAIRWVWKAGIYAA
jgi:hypothetical protein